MPSATTTPRHLVHAFFLLGLATVMTTMLASNRDKFGGHANILPFGLFNRTSSIGQNSVLDPHDLSKEQNSQEIKTMSQLSRQGDSLLDKMFEDDLDILLHRRLIDVAIRRSRQKSAKHEQDRHEMSNSRNSREIKSDRKNYRSWGHFMFDLLEHSDDFNHDDVKLLQPQVLDRTGHEYRHCAELCDFHFLRRYPSEHQSLFPSADVERRQRYCSACRSELIREAKERAESLLGGVSREAAREGCWDEDGILHQLGEEFMSWCNYCTCGWRGSSICSLMACYDPYSELWRTPQKLLPEEFQEAHDEDNVVDDPSLDQRDPVETLLFADDMEELHEMHNKQIMSPEIKAGLIKHRSWGNFLCYLLEQGEDTNDDDITLLQPIVFKRTGLEYRKCAEKCGYFHPYPSHEFSYEPLDDPQRKKQYCSTCHSEMIRVAKNRAESLLVGVSREAAREGCWDSDGILHQPGENFQEKCNRCSCGWGGISLCTLMACF